MDSGSPCDRSVDGHPSLIAAADRQGCRTKQAIGSAVEVKLEGSAVATACRADIDFADRCAEVDILVKGVGPVRHVAQIVAPRYVARLFNLEPALAAVTGALDLLGRRLGGYA